jgi:hypothetical protein
MADAKNRDDADYIDENGPPPLPTRDQLVDVLERLTQIQERQPIPQQTVAQATFITPWNPTGSKTRPRLRRKVFLNNHVLSDGRLTDEEVMLINTLKHGRYHNRQWLVIEKDEEGTSSLLILLPNKTESQRIEMARTCPAGLVDALRMIHREMTAVAVA